MALNKVAATQVGNFGKLTGGGHSKVGNSIFGDNACHNVCSFENAFKSLTVGDNSALDIFSPKGQEMLQNEIKIIKNEDKPPKTSKTFEMNEKALFELQEELGEHVQRKTFGG